MNTCERCGKVVGTNEWDIHTCTPKPRLVDDLFKAIHKYDETLYMATVIGVLELVKQQLINESVENQDEDRNSNGA